MVSLNCEVANHTNDHKYLSKIGADAIVSQVQATSQKIQNACGVAPKLVRPPGGYYDAASLKVLGNLGVPAIMSVSYTHLQSGDDRSDRRVL